MLILLGSLTHLSPLLPTGAASQEAADLEAVERALEAAPDDPTRLADAAQAALDAGDADKAFWYLTLAAERAHGDRALSSRLGKLRGTLKLPEVATDSGLENYTQALFKLARTCESRKLYANAVDLLTSCRGTRFEERAEERLAKLLKKDKAVAALLESGIEVPTRTKLRLSQKEIAREDLRHAAWEDAYEVKGKYYTVTTNIGYEMAHAISAAMEQMNSFYRTVFGYKQRGGSMRRCRIKVYRSRAEFDKFEDMGQRQTVGGFYRPGENSVTTYDGRGSGKDLSDLWSTLFHEASHQFTRTVWPNQIPTWLNEGTASYFEGAFLLPNGSVAFNRIPDGRLRNVIALIGRGSPSVRDVVTYFQGGSYPGAYYPFGWALVYFCRNYEDQEFERVYLPVYQDFMQTYKGGGKHDVFERFTEYFVERAEVPGVETFEDFVALWEAWIRDLGKLHFGGPDQADRLLTRARAQRAAGKLEPAVASFRWALRKRPRDPQALHGLADVLAELGAEDAALYSYRQLAALARAVPAQDPMPGYADQTAGDVLRIAESGAGSIDPTVADGLAAARTELVEATGEAARGLGLAGFPRVALLLVNTAETVMGSHGALADVSANIPGAEAVDLRRWRRLEVAGGLEHWAAGEGWSAATGNLTLDTQSMQTCIYRQDLPARYDFEARVQAGTGGKLPVVGLAYGPSLGGAPELFAIIPKSGTVGLFAFVDGQPTLIESFAVQYDRELTEHRLSLGVTPTSITFHLDGKQVGQVSGNVSASGGRVGVFGQATRAVFSELRLRY